MNKFESELLSIAYKNYLQTGSTYGSFRMRNGNDFMYYHTVASYLCDNEYLEALSDNILEDSISIFDNLLEFELTEKGLDYCKSNLKL